jgi:hypothetical protein
MYCTLYKYCVLIQVSDGVYSSVKEPNGPTYDTPKELSLIDFGEDGGKNLYDNSGKMF